MKSFIAILFASILSVQVNAEEVCPEFEYNFKSCSFQLEKSNDGELSSSAYENRSFKGLLISKCQSGKHVILKEKCDFEPENLEIGQCAGIKAVNWYGQNKEECSHPELFEVLDDGERKKIFSINGSGYIDYKCENGNIKKKSTSCGLTNKNNIKPNSAGSPSLPVPPVSAFSQGFGTEAVVEQCGFFITGLMGREHLGAGSFTDPTSSAMDSACETRCSSGGYDKFSGNDSFTADTLETINLTCECCNFNAGTPPVGCTNYINPITPDSAEIRECNISGDWNEADQEFTTNPSGNDTKIRQEVCEANGYSNLDSTVSSDVNLPLIDDFRVVAVCSGNNNPPNADPCRGALLGDEAAAQASGVLYTCELGQCWELDPSCSNMTVPAETCEPCTAGMQTWGDPDVAGGVCTASLPLVASGDAKTVSFFNGSFNGEVAVSCNNENWFFDISNCYNNCTGGLVTWGDGLLSNYYNQDKAGQCQATVPNAQYRNDVLSPTLNTTNNNGDAAFRCNGLGGVWEIEAQECNLDCPADVFFPNYETVVELDNVGRRKGWQPTTDSRQDMACAFSYGSPIGHSPSTIRNINDSDPWNNGSASIRCVDGFWEVDSYNCDLHCPAQNIEWGSGTSRDGRSKVNQCNANFSKTADNANATASASLSNWGNASYNCDDGEFSLNAQVCNLDCSTSIPAQTFSDNGRTCGISGKTVGSITHNDVHVFRNEVGINIGSFTAQCNDGLWDVTGTCAPKPCPSRAATWSGYGNCSGTIPAGVEGDIVTVTDSVFTTGSAQYECRNTNDASDTGEWVQITPNGTTACYMGCNSGVGKNWTNSQSCSGTITSTGIHNATTSVTDSSYPPSGGGTGTASYTCNGTNGNWDLNSSSCILSRDDDGSWGTWSNCNPLGSCGNPSSGSTTTFAQCEEERFFNETRTTTGIGRNDFPPHNTRETRWDTTNSCPLDCIGSWGSYVDVPGTCNQSTGQNTERRTYSITRNAANGGAACPFADGATQDRTANCSVNCQGSWGSWTDAGSCNTSTGFVPESREYTISVTAKNGGAACPHTNGEIDTRNNVKTCTVNCSGSWSNTTTCTETCGGGVFVQEYSIDTIARNGGTACGNSDGDTRNGTTACNTQSCANYTWQLTVPVFCTMIGGQPTGSISGPCSNEGDSRIFRNSNNSGCTGGQTSYRRYECLE